jgi:WD40 repeat protein
MSECSLVLAFLTGLTVAAAPPAPPGLDRYGDPLPPGAVARLGTVRWRHCHAFHRPVLSPDGRWLVSTPPLPTRLYVWETATGRLVRTLEGGAFWSYAFLPDGKRFLAVVDRQDTLTQWEFPSFRLVERWPVRSLTKLTVSPDGRQLAGLLGGTPYVLDLSSHKPRVVASVPAGNSTCLAFTPDGGLTAMVVRASPRAEPSQPLLFVHVDLRTRHAWQSTVESEQGSARPLAVAPDGRHLLTQTVEGRVRLWRPEKGKDAHLVAIPRLGNRVSLAFRPDSKTIVAVDHSRGLLCNLGVDRGEVLDRVRLPVVPPLCQQGEALVSKDGRTLFLVGPHALTGLDLRTGRPLHGPGLVDPVEALAWSRDGRSLLANTQHHRTDWDIRTGRLVDAAVFPPFDQGQIQIVQANCPRGRCRAVAHGGRIRVAAAGKGVLYQRWHDHPVIALAFNSDGRLLASVDMERGVRLWDVVGGRQLGFLDARRTAHYVGAVLFTPDSRQLILVEQGGRVHLWDVRTGTLLRSLRPAAENRSGDYFRWPMVACLSPCGGRLFVAYQGLLRAWDLRAGREMGPWEQIAADPHISPSPMLSISPDGRYLARIERGLVLYEVASGRIVYSSPDPCTAIAFHPSRGRLAVARERLDILLYDLGVLFQMGSAQIGEPSLQQLWTSLVDSDARGASRAARQLARTPGMETFLARQMRPVSPLDSRWLAGRIADLASDEFATRVSAEQALAAVAELAQAELRRAYQQTRDLEQRQRLGRLLDGLTTPSPHRLRQHRAVLALELRGTPQARRLLGELARGAPAAWLTGEAKDALRRLSRSAP